ncbi:MAG: efflux RND transporter periplasmic adaptor subunit [Proteobacteria bacterium]|nr:efflux RND transporter periplasmic adaptor subunit [Pseudomonadota bacterium]
MAFRNASSVIVVVLCVELFMACTMNSGASGENKGLRFSGGQDGGPGQAVPVEVMALETGEIEALLRFSANLEAEGQVQVLARAAGPVKTLLVEEGDAVKRGQVLLRVEDEEQRIKLAQVDNDLARARREYDQQLVLHKKGVASDQTLATATYELKRLELMRKDAARALRYAVVRAPIPGTVTQRLVKLGQTVNVQQPLFDITDFDTLVARIFVPEKELPRLKVGLVARIMARAGHHDGLVERIAPAVDPRTGTVKVTIAVPRKQTLMPGMFVEIALVVDRHHNAVLLPKRALVYDNDVPYAFKLAGEDRAVRIKVEPLLENRDFVEPGSGFAPGDQIVVAGQIGLKHNALVSVRRGPAEPEAGPAERDGEVGPAAQDRQASTRAGGKKR